jgi:hypothetical protein
LQASIAWKHWSDDGLLFRHVSTRSNDVDDVRVVVKTEEADTGLRRRVIWTNADHYLFVIQYLSTEERQEPEPLLLEEPVEEDSGYDALDSTNDKETTSPTVAMKETRTPVFQSSVDNDGNNTNKFIFMSALGLVPKAKSNVPTELAKE